MFVKKIEISNFRNLQQVELNFSKYLNFFIGDNAQGKTNLLESLYILSLLKSFRTRNDKELILFEKDFFSIRGFFLDESQIEKNVYICFSKSDGKRILLDGKVVRSYSDYIGKFPLVLFSSQDFEIISGAPAVRRKLFNIIISQCSKKYLYHLQEFERTIKHRNRVLFKLGQSKYNKMDEIESWNIQLIKHSEPIIQYRQRFIDEINKVLEEKYALFHGADKKLKIKYIPNVSLSYGDDLKKVYQKILSNVFKKELNCAFTLCGPHRDDFIFMIGDKQTRQYGSRGEHKSALVCFKAAECQMIQQRLNVLPIIILDDIFSEFDRNRADKVIELFFEKGQCFISGTFVNTLKNDIKEKKKFFVTNGSVTLDESE